MGKDDALTGYSDACRAGSGQQTARQRAVELEALGIQEDYNGNLDGALQFYMAALELDPSNQLLKDKIESVRAQQEAGRD